MIPPIPLPAPHSGVGRGQGGGAKFSICKFLKSDSCKWFYFRFIFLIFMSRLCIAASEFIRWAVTRLRCLLMGVVGGWFVRPRMFASQDTFVFRDPIRGRPLPFPRQSDGALDPGFEFAYNGYVSGNNSALLLCREQLCVPQQI